MQAPLVVKASSAQNCFDIGPEVTSRSAHWGREPF
jgi:hypothetical protein